MEQIDGRASTPAPPAGPDQRPWLRRALGWFRLLHPFPSLVVASTGLGFAALASPRALAPDHAARLACMLAASQFAVGAFNDYCDADLDAAAKPGRPIPAGVATRGGALLATAALLAAALALAASFGPATLALAVLGTAAGLVYDRLLKRTPWSWAPYVLGLPILPLWSWSTLGELPLAAGWAYPFGALLALALHLANALPDDESDREARVGGLVQFLGRPASLVILFLSFGLALAFGLVVGYLARGPQPHGLAILLGGIIGLVALALASRAATDRAAFPLLAVGSALLAIGVAGALLA